jgi:hypothetical protein
MHATLLSHWLSKFFFPNYVPPQFFPTLVPHSMSKDIYLSYIKKPYWSLQTIIKYHEVQVHQ